MPAAKEASGLTVRVPAEWEEHRACWVAWPSHPELWHDDFEGARREFAAMCAAIRGEALECLVLDEVGRAEAASALASLDVRFHRARFGDIWLRDTAPLTVVDADGGPRAVSFRFNGWGGRYLLDGDAEVAGRVAGLQGLDLERLDLVCEGGAIDSDGEGTLLSTRSCLSNPNRNPGRSPAELEGVLERGLGARRVVWLERGLLNDHTDGHVDTLARFVGPATVLCMRAGDRSDPNRDALEQAADVLGSSKDARGRALRVLRIPSPGRVEDREGNLLPASYLNFYIANASVVVPVYGSRYDEEALAGIAGCFAGRKVVGVRANSILTGGGAFHCITQQEPRAARAEAGQDRRT